MTLAAVYIITLGAGVVTTMASHWSGACKTFPDPNILYFNGATGIYTGIVQAEAMAEGNSWHQGSIINLTQVYGPGQSDQVNVYDVAEGHTQWGGYADDNPPGACPAQYWNVVLNTTALDPAPTDWKHSTACHELGHTFGLGHPMDTTSCMTDSLNHFPVSPNAHDFAELNSVYNGGGGGSPPPPPPPECGYDLQCFPSLRQCEAVCCGVCERRINCGGATAHKCFEN